MASRPSLPSGRVTFAFVDVVGSTRTFHEHGDEYVAAQRELHTTVARHAEQVGGVVVTTEGDGAFLAFSDATSAVSALVALQAELEQPAGDGLRLRLRSGAHTGDAVPVDGNYLAVAVHVAARVAGTANAGQVLVTDAVVEELGTPAVELGTYSLKDLPEPTRIWRVAGDSTPPRATPARRTNVPEARTSFVGRDEELDRLRERVAAPGLVTVVGPGGTGKTRLVSELALRDAEATPGGIWLVELASLDSAGHVTGAAAAAVGLTSNEAGELVEVLRRRGRSVLVLDNCEHLLDGVAGLVEELLGTCPELTVLCTSREALDLPGERAIALAPLPLEGAATQLFLDRAVDAAATTPDLDLVFRLCAALDGLPLAIELAASQARAAPLEEILKAVTAGTDSLERRRGETRQRSLDAVLQWSVDRLDPEVRSSLLTLSVFPGRFDPDMARAVLTAAPQGDPTSVPVLTRASLVDLDGSDYRLLWTIRDAARRLLELDGDLHREAMDALAAWAAAFGEERYRILTHHEDVPDDLLLAVEAAVNHALTTALPGLGRACHLLAVTANSRGAGGTMLELMRRVVSAEPVDLDSVVAICAGVAVLEHHDVDSLVPTATFATMKELAAGRHRVLADLLHAQAVREGNLGHGDRSLALWHEALALSETHEEARHELPTVLGNLGYAYYYYAGDRAAAIEFNARALEAGAGPYVRAIARLNLAEYALIEDRREDARALALAAIRESPPMFKHRGVSLSLLARALNRLGDRESALAAAREALELLDSPRSDRGDIDELESLFAELPELRS